MATADGITALAGKPRNEPAVCGKALAEAAEGRAHTAANAPLVRTNSRRESWVADLSFNRFSGNAEMLLNLSL
jgi:hypothetical protein